MNDYSRLTNLGKEIFDICCVKTFLSLFGTLPQIKFVLVFCTGTLDIVQVRTGVKFTINFLQNTWKIFFQDGRIFFSRQLLFLLLIKQCEIREMKHSFIYLNHSFMFCTNMLGGPSPDPPITRQKYANFIKSNVKTRFLVIC